jgi:hypothetical protein
VQKFNNIKQNGLLDASFFAPIESAISNGDIGATYTLLTTKVENLEELQRELSSSHFKSVQ